MIKLSKPRKRTVILAGGSLAILFYSFMSDPNGGALTAALLGHLALPILAIWVGYIAIQALFDYIDGEELYKKAVESSIGAGLVFLARSLVLLAVLGLFGTQLNNANAQSVETYIPPAAIVYIPVIKAEQQQHWSNHPKAIYSQV